MASLSDLLAYKEEIEIINPKTGKPVKKVWVRILGDYDLQRAYKSSRIASSKKRQALRDPNSDDYQDEVLGVYDLTRTEKEDLVRTAQINNIISEAQMAVERSELPKIEEIAIDGDAPTLEDLEELDKRESLDDEEYKKKLENYIDTKTIELDAQLKIMSDEDLTQKAMFEVSNIVPFSVFLAELDDYKLYYGVFKDRTCKDKEFESLEDIKNLPSDIKGQILKVLAKLELGQEEIKN
jgi:hypothetical protein